MGTTSLKRTAIYACIPFILLGFAGFGWLAPSFVELFFFLGSVFAMFALFVAGWAKDFPRWSLPAIGFCLLYSAYMMGVAVPVISKEVLGLWAWLPFATALILAVLIKPSFEPVKQLFYNFRKYPELIFFVFFGFTPVINLFICDEINSIWLIPVFIINTLILTAGLFVFLTYTNRKTRNYTIISSFILSILLTMTFHLFQTN